MSVLIESKISKKGNTSKDKPGILLKCPNPVCEGKIWRYTGAMKVYAVCPDCRRSIRIAKHKVKE